MSETTCGRCAWCLNDHTPRRRGYELTCPHGFGCCQNCSACFDQLLDRLCEAFGVE